jgi:hypothetical protein
MKRVTVLIKIERTTARERRSRAYGGVMDLRVSVMIRTRATEDVSTIVRV